MSAKFAKSQGPVLWSILRVCPSCREAGKTRRAIHTFSSQSRIFLGNAASILRARRIERVYSSEASSGLATGSHLPNPDVPVKTRFAPSPTGYLHIGGLRTALFSYLLARRCGGRFVLRIEDTDQKRLVSDAEQRLIEDLKWAGLHWDEGPGIGGECGPYRQSERTEIYQVHSRQLLDNGSAYRCFCKPQEAVAYATSACYQNCSSLSHEESLERAESGREPFTVRLVTPADAGKRVYTDLTYKRIQRLKRSPAASLTPSEDDLAGNVADTVLMKSDGTPTYHFANVVDDHLMRITHVIRGEEWLASTPLHFDIYSAFGWKPPQFAHVGLLVDQNQAKLSKRSGNIDLGVRDMCEKHKVSPTALNNFLVLLGWRNPMQTDVMDMDELSRVFNLKFTPGNTMVQLEKLWYLQKQHFRRLFDTAQSQKNYDLIRHFVEQITAEVRRRHSLFKTPTALQALVEDGIFQDDLEAYCAAIFIADAHDFQTVEQHVERNQYFFQRPDLAEVKNYNLDPKAQVEQDVVLYGVATSLLNEANFAQSYDLQEGVTPSAESRILPRMYLAQRKIQAALVQQIWDATLRIFSTTPEAAKLPAESLPRVPFFYQTPLRQEMATLLLTEWSGNSTRPTQPTQKQISALTKIHKDVQKKLIAYLRERLAGGPGPSITNIMLILGYDECCARLGVEPDASRGWEPHV